MKKTDGKKTAMPLQMNLLTQEERKKIDWYTIPPFAKLQPTNVFHREQDEVAAERVAAANIAPKNLHVLARAAVYLDEEKGQRKISVSDQENLFLDGQEQILKIIQKKTGEKERLFLSISADDYYKLYVNGTFVTQGPAPAVPEQYYYNELDLTDYLQPGKNVLAVHLYYQGLINRVWNSGDNRFGLYAKLRAETKKHEMGLQWRYQICKAYSSGGTVGYETQFLENFDSRLWEADWNSLDYDDSTWERMIPWDAADYQLLPQPTRQLSVYEKKPIFMEIREDRSLFIDFGEEVTGGLRLCARGHAGDELLLRFGEECTENGHVRFELRCNCRYEERWTLADGVCRLEPYDYKGFRYAEILPVKKLRLVLSDAQDRAEADDILLSQIRAEVRHYPMDEAACRLECSEALLSDIFRICKNAVRLGTQEGYLDCPTREKGQYLGDAIVTAHAQILLTGETALLRKCIRQFLLTQKTSLGLLAVAPGAFMQELADFSLLFSQLLLLDYSFTGDAVFLEECYPAAAEVVVAYARYARPDGLLEQVSEQWNMVDWPENLRDGYDFPLTRPIVAPGCHNVINALYIGAVKTLEEIEEILNKTQQKRAGKHKGTLAGEAAYSGNITKAQLCQHAAESRAQGRSWQELAKRFQEVFFRGDTGLLADSETSMHCSFHANLYPLYFGLIPEEKEAHVAEWMTEKGLCCGVMISYYALKALAGAGHWDAVYQLIMNPSEHGWVNMLREGATTAFEAWGKEQKWNTSLCHPWASAPIPLLIEDIAGFQPDPKQPSGFRFEPHIPKQLKKLCLEVPFRGKQYRITSENGNAVCEELRE